MTLFSLFRAHLHALLCVPPVSLTLVDSVPHVLRVRSALRELRHARIVRPIKYLLPEPDHVLLVLTDKEPHQCVLRFARIG